MRKALALTILLLALASAAVANAQSFVTFSAPHTARRSSASLDTTLSARVQARVAAKPPTTTQEAIDMSLELTAAQLHFGLNHTTKLTFDTTEREGNCIEYAQLFANVFDRAAAQGHITARAYAVHSADARLLGQLMPGRGMGEHDWVLVVDGEKRTYVDPTFFDMGLPWDISRSVTGTVTVP